VEEWSNDDLHTLSMKAAQWDAWFSALYNYSYLLT